MNLPFMFNFPGVEECPKRLSNPAMSSTTSYRFKRHQLQSSRFFYFLFLPTHLI